MNQARFAPPTPTWSDWAADVLGTGYEQATLSLGEDPDGEGEIFATLVRYTGARNAKTNTANPAAAAVLYLHGYTDYFFQRHLAVHFADLGYAFYAIDVRKCGRSIRSGQTPHYTTDLARYDLELGLALDKVASAEGGADAGGSVLAMAHSTGGLVMPLWLDRMNRRRDPSLAKVTGLVLNSPWFDLQGHAMLRNVAVTGVIGAVGRLRGHSVVPGAPIDTYGASIHAGRSGEWDYDLDWKPLAGFPVRFGWLRAIRAGHRRLHRGLDVGVPAMILRSKLSVRAKRYGPDVDVADAVLDVRQIQRWAGCLGQRTTIVPIPDARHDVFLSTEPVRTHAFAELATWLDWLRDHHAHDQTS